MMFFYAVQCLVVFVCCVAVMRIDYDSFYHPSYLQFCCCCSVIIISVTSLLSGAIMTTAECRELGSCPLLK